MSTKFVLFYSQLDHKKVRGKGGERERQREIYRERQTDRQTDIEGHKGHVSFFSGLELVKHDVERGIVEHKVDFVLVEHCVDVFVPYKCMFVCVCV